MSGEGVPGWARAVLGLLLPAAYREEVLEALQNDAGRRFGARDTGRARVALWYLAQVLSPGMLRLAWRLRARGRHHPVGSASLRSGGGARSGLWSDVGHAARSLGRSPLFTFAAVVSLALGIGANTAIFTVVNAVLLRPVPYEEPDRLTFIWNNFPGFEQTRLPLSGFEVTELRKEEATFEDVGGIWATNQTLVDDGRAVLTSSGLVTPNFFSVLGVDPVLGRSFLPDDGGDDDAWAVILSDGLWRRSFGADPNVLGHTVQLEGGDAVIVGVLPRGLKLMFPSAVGVPEHLDLYAPYPWAQAARPGGSRFLRTVGRTRPGVSAEVADATVKAVAARLRRTYDDIGQLGDDFSVAPLHADTVEAVRPILLALLGGVAIFLLLTAVNVASLILARTASRQRELTVRTCLGASRRRLARLLMAEVGIVTGLGAVLGLALGWWGVDVLWALRPEGIARVDEVRLDLAVVGFTVAAAILAACIAGLGPLLRLRRQGPMELLRETGMAASGGGREGRRLVTAAEVALTVVLVVGAGLLAQAFTRLQRADIGFQPDGLLTFRVGLSTLQFPTDEERARLARQVERELLAQPGVISAGGGSHVPLADWANWSGSAPPEGTPEEERESFHFDHRSVTPGYLESLGATLVAGRFFRQEDTGASDPVIIVDEALARRAYPGGDPVGRRLLATRYVGGSFQVEPAVIVGVIRDIRDRSPAVPSGGQVYWPFAQSARWELTYVVRTDRDPTVLVEGVRALVPGIRPDLAAADFRLMTDYVADATAETRFTALLAGIFSTLALLLAGLGLYSVISYSTAQRTREMGLRLALGAHAGNLFLTVVGEGMGVGILGVLAGLAAAGGLTRYLSALLFEVDPLDPLVFGSVAAFVLGVAVAASAAPALRATRVDPVRSLQAE